MVVAKKKAKTVRYVYKAMNNYYSNLTNANKALKSDGWTTSMAKKEGIKIYKMDVKSRKIVETYTL